MTARGREADNSVMTDHVMGGWAPRVLRGLFALVLGAAAAAGGVLFAVVSFDWAAWAPALVSLGLIVAGALIYRQAEDLIVRGIGLGLVIGGVATVPLWSFLPVDTGGGLESHS